jgi:hypothetical protein
MEHFLDRSDELHMEVLRLLENVRAYPGIRHEVALVACGLALEHALGLRLLVRTACYSSALAMMRLQYEAIARGVWLLYAASDRQIEILTSPLTTDSETAAKKMPMFAVMLGQIIEKAPPQPSRMLQGFKDVNWDAMNSFIHSGVHPLRRHVEGYPPELIETVVRNSNGLNIMALQLGVALSGDRRFEGVVKAFQEEFHDALPALISPLD